MLTLKLSILEHHHLTIIFKSFLKDVNKNDNVIKFLRKKNVFVRNVTSHVLKCYVACAEINNQKYFELSE